MKKGVIWGLISALTIVTSAVGTNIYLSAKQAEKHCTISASRVSYTLDEGIEEADAVAEIQIVGVVEERNDSDLPKTIHKAHVLETYKGNLPDEINILQDGTFNMPISDNPIMEKGEKYLLVMKKSKLHNDYDQLYWILKEYFVSGNQAVETLPTGELTAEEEEIRIYDSKKNWNKDMAQKESELTYESEILNKSDLIEMIEEVK